MKADLLRTTIQAQATFEVSEPEVTYTGWQEDQEFWFAPRLIVIYLHLDDNEWVWHQISVRGKSGWSDGSGAGPSTVHYHRERDVVVPAWLVDLVEGAIKALDDEAPRRDAVDREASDAPAD